MLLNIEDIFHWLCITFRKSEALTGGYLQKISIVEESTYTNLEEKLMLNITELLLKENLITLDEKMLLTMLIKEGHE